MDWKQAVTVGIVMGLIAAGVVWYLERFQMEQMHARFEETLANHAAFQEWLVTHNSGQATAAPPAKTRKGVKRDGS